MKNNCVENLEWATRNENMQHAYYVLKRKIGLAYGHRTPIQNKGKKNV